MQELLGNCLDEAGVAIDMSSASSDVFWREAQLSMGSMPDIRITQEILWELYELNFRFELIALGQRAQLAPREESVAEESTHQMWLIACFPNNSLLVADVSYAKKLWRCSIRSPSLITLAVLQSFLTLWTLLLTHLACLLLHEYFATFPSCLHCGPCFVCLSSQS
jgi:hypothetical protein